MKATTGKRRTAFTLIETLLVLALIVMMIGIVWPAIRGPLESHRLRKAAQTLRSEWSRARNRSMLRGKVLEFSYLPESADYQIAESQTLNDATAFLSNFGSGAEQASSAPAPSEGQLPEGVVFVESVLSLATDANAEKVDGNSRGGGWSRPITFYPDGTTDDAEVTLANERGGEITVTLRGLTGGTTSGDVLQSDGRAR